MSFSKEKKKKKIQSPQFPFAIITTSDWWNRLCSSGVFHDVFEGVGWIRLGRKVKSVVLGACRQRGAGREGRGLDAAKAGSLGLKQRWCVFCFFFHLRRLSFLSFLHAISGFGKMCVMCVMRLVSHVLHVSCLSIVHIYEAIEKCPRSMNTAWIDGQGWWPCSGRPVCFGLRPTAQEYVGVEE